MDDYKNAILINIDDNVATVLDPIKKNDKVNIMFNNQNIKMIIALDDIDLYHKIAIKDINKGNEIIKYGEVIGKAVDNIMAGQLAHVSNIESVRVKG